MEPYCSPLTRRKCPEGHFFHTIFAVWQYCVQVSRVSEQMFLVPLDRRHLHLNLLQGPADCVNYQISWFFWNLLVRSFEVNGRRLLQNSLRTDTPAPDEVGLDRERVVEGLQAEVVHKRADQRLSVYETHRT